MLSWQWWKRGLLISERGRSRFDVVRMGLLLTDGSVVVEHLLVSGAPRQVSWVFTAAVYTFWSADWLFPVFVACGWSHLTHFPGLPQ